MAWVSVATLSQLAPGSVIEAACGDGLYAICNVDGRIHALSGICPHRGGPLGQGAVNGGSVTCPWHAWEFDCLTGAHDYNPSVRVPTFPVRIDGDSILIDIP
jgi:nitrite reductase (NADH) small subunit